jgi:hypothetical protein
VILNSFKYPISYKNDLSDGNQAIFEIIIQIKILKVDLLIHKTNLAYLMLTNELKDSSLLVILNSFKYPISYNIRTRDY